MNDFHRDSFLAYLSEVDREVLLSLGTPRQYRSRTVLFHQGDPSRHVVLLLDGWVKITSTSRSGEEALLALRGPGDILGEQSAVDGQPRSATTEALLPSKAVVIEAERLIRCLSQHPALALTLLRHISLKLRESDRNRLDFVSTSSSRRIAELVLRLAVQHGERTPEGISIGLPLSQRELAIAAATSREVAARTLRTLRERDVVRTHRQRIVVVRPDVLRSLCGSVSTGQSDGPAQANGLPQPNGTAAPPYRSSAGRSVPTDTQ